MNGNICYGEVKSDRSMLTEVIHSEDFIQRLGSLLTNKQTRCSGLNILKEYLDYLDVAVLERKANLWITLSFKAYFANEFYDNGAVFFHMLEKLMLRFQESSNLYKSFESNHLRKLYDIINTSSEEVIKNAMPCLLTCLKNYYITDASSKDLIENNLNKLINTTDNELSMFIGKCKQLLCVRRGNQEQNANQWQIYHQSLLDSINESMDIMFSKCPQMGSLRKHQHKNSGARNQPFQLISEYIRFHNLINYMVTALREPYPAPKRIKPKPILDLINRGLSVTHLTLKQNPIAENIELALILHKLHLDLLNLLSALLITCRCYLKSYFPEIIDLLTDALNSLTKIIEGRNLNGNENCMETPLLILRSKIYSTISECLTILKVGCRVPSIMESLVNEIFKDITPIDNKFTFEVISNTSKNVKKKSLPKMQNVHSHLAKFYTSSDNLKKAKYQFKNGKIEVCISALRCLQKLFENSIYFLTCSLTKLIQFNITKLCCQLYQYRTISNAVDYLYNDESCRLELLKTLYVTYVTAHYLDTEFSEITVKILQTLQFHDKSLSIRNCCGTLLHKLEMIQHPQKESLLTPPDLSLSNYYKNHNLFKQFVETSSCNDISDNSFNNNTEMNITSDECLINENNEKGDEEDLPDTMVENNINILDYIENEQQITSKQFHSEIDDDKHGENESQITSKQFHSKIDDDKHEKNETLTSDADMVNIITLMAEEKGKEKDPSNEKDQRVHENDKDNNVQINKKLKLIDDVSYNDVELNNQLNLSTDNSLSAMLEHFVDELN